MQEKAGRQFNRWLRKFSAELQTLLLIQIFKTKALNTQFGPFSRDNLTPQTLILSAHKLLHRHKQIKIQARFKHKKPNVWATLPMNLEIETLSSIGRGSIGMKAQKLILSLLWRWYIIFSMNIFFEVWFAPLWCYQRDAMPM